MFLIISIRFGLIVVVTNALSGRGTILRSSKSLSDTFSEQDLLACEGKPFRSPLSHFWPWNHKSLFSVNSFAVRGLVAMSLGCSVVFMYQMSSMWILLRILVTRFATKVLMVPVPNLCPLMH